MAETSRVQIHRKTSDPASANLNRLSVHSYIVCFDFRSQALRTQQQLQWQWFHAWCLLPWGLLFRCDDVSWSLHVFIHGLAMNLPWSQSCCFKTGCSSPGSPLVINVLPGWTSNNFGIDKILWISWNVQTSFNLQTIINRGSWETYEAWKSWSRCKRILTCKTQKQVRANRTLRSNTTWYQWSLRQQLFLQQESEKQIVFVSTQIYMKHIIDHNSTCKHILHG